MQVLQRETWYSEPKQLGDCFRLRKMKCDRQLEAVCQLWSHQFGWELKLLVAGELQRSQVCRSQEDVFDTFESVEGRDGR